MNTPAFLHSYRRRRQLIWGALGVLLIISILDHAGLFGFEGSDRDRYGFVDTTVVTAVDANTLEVDLPDSSQPRTRIHLSGIDCPAAESYFGREAAAFVQSNVVGKRVRVILDPNHRLRDREGRLLAYLYFLPAGEMVNQQLVDRGFAYADLRFEHVMKHSFVEHEKRATKARTGLWAGVTPEQMPEWRRRMSVAAVN